LNAARRQPLLDAPARVLPGPFTADLRPRDLLHAAVVFAPRAPARMLELDLAEAARSPGVVAVLGAGDLPPPLNAGLAPLLVTDTVRCASDRLAVVAAETLQAARDAALRVFARLEDTMGSWDAGKAHLTTAPRVWPGKPNMTVVTRYKVGTAARVLPRLHAIHRRYTLPWQDPLALEGQVVLAVPTPNGVEVRGALEEPGLAALAVAAALRLPASGVAVVPMDMGGALGHRGAFAAELAALCAVLACRTNRPVVLRLSREEELRHGPKRPRCVVDHTLGADDAGRVRAQVVKVLWDGGPYPDLDRDSMAHTAAQAAGPYDVAHQDVTVAVARTHNSRPFFPPGGAQLPLTLAMEGQMDALARQGAVDPRALRRHNLPPANTKTAVLARSARTCLEVLDGLWPAEPNAAAGDAWRRRGLGMALATWVPQPPQPAPVLVEVLADGSVTVCAGLVEGGGWQRQGLAVTVARALGVPAKDVTVLPPDARWLNTARSPARGATTVDHAAAALRACAHLQYTLTLHAAAMLGVPSRRVRLGPKGFVCGKKRVGWTQLAAHAFSQGIPLMATSGTFAGPPAPPAAAAHLAQVEVDLATGAVRVLGLWMVQDVGQVLLVDGVRRALEGGARQAMGYALTEELALDAGQTTHASLRLTHPLGSLDEPAMKMVVLEGGVPRPVTALAALAAAPAVRNAIANALGDAPLELPCTPERILEVLMGQGLDPLGQPARVVAAAP
jgi:CO/xanthine dehydrogenase Mo-binding subunit